MRSLPYLLIGLWSSCVAARGTTIVGIWTEKHITIAADSKQTLSNNGVIVGSQDACKVFEVRHLVFALAGLAQTDVVNVIEEIRYGTPLKQEGTGKTLPIESIVVRAIGSIVKTLRAHGATKGFPNDTIQLLIAGKIDGELQLVRVELSGVQIYGDFSFPSATRQYSYPQSRGHDGTDPNRGIEVIGIGDTVQRFQTVLPEWNKENDVALARRLVAIEASDSAAYRFVGPPISTIVIDNKGNHWIEAGVCTWEAEGKQRKK